MRSHLVVRTALLLSALVAPAAAQDAPPSAPPPPPPPMGAAPWRGAEPGPPRHHRFEDEPGEMRMASHASGDGFPLAGEHGGKFYLRDANDNYRLYPGLFLQADTRAYFGRGLDDLHGTQGSTTRDKMYLRRARFDLGGEVLKSWSFYLTGDFAGATAQNPNGAPHLEHALIDVELHRLAHVTVGQQQVPFTMENRTNPAMYQWMERPLAVRFAQPSDKDIGIMAWGETRQHFFAYEAGVFSGDGPNRPNVDNRVDLAGRVHFRPLAGTQTIARNIQIGFSGTWGVRQHQDVLYDMPTLATDGGFVFFNANHTDPATGKTLHVLPSGTQSGFAGEVRVPVSRLDLRFEFVSVRRNTREALEGYVATNTERYGHLSGTAFYAQLGVWVLGKPSMRQDPGEFKTPHIRFPRGEPNRPARGLEVVARAESLRATYYAGDRANADVQPAADRNISVDVVGAGVNYYATTHAMVAINYNYNIFPSSWSTDNAALAPGNVPCGKVGGTPTDQACHTGAHSLHELAARVQIYF